MILKKVGLHARTYTYIRFKVSIKQRWNQNRSDEGKLRWREKETERDHVPCTQQKTRDEHAIRSSSKQNYKSNKVIIHHETQAQQTQGR